MTSCRMLEGMGEMSKEERDAAAARRARRQGRGPIGTPPGDGGGPVEVLSLLGHFATWVQYRGHRQRAFLASHGIRHGWSHARDAATLKAEIEARGVRVVLNEVWHLPLPEMARLAADFPAVQFVPVNHGVPGWVATRYSKIHYEILRLARELPNCHYGTVMSSERVAAPVGSKVVSLPNFCTLPEDLPEREPGPPTVSLIARDEEGKQWGAAIAAVALAARSVPDLHVVVGCPDVFGGIGPHLAHLDEIGVPWARMLWGDWESYLDRVARTVDCHLTASTAESFCLVPLEHCLLGRPAVGTPAVEWLPERWQAHTQRPADLACRLTGLFSDYESSSRHARGVAGNVVDRNHRHLIASLHRLLG